MRKNKPKKSWKAWARVGPNGELRDLATWRMCMPVCGTDRIVRVSVKQLSK